MKAALQNPSVASWRAALAACLAAVVAPVTSLPTVAAARHDGAPTKEVTERIRGGEFSEEDAGTDAGLNLLMEKALRADNPELTEPEGVGVGRLAGWRTEIDGRRRVWVERGGRLGRCLQLIPGNQGSVDFVSDPFPLEPDIEYVFSCLVQRTGDTTLECRVLTEPPDAVDARLEVIHAPRARSRPPDWQRIETTFRVERPATLPARVSLRATGAGTALFDNVSLRRRTDEDRLRDESRQCLTSLDQQLEQSVLLGYELDVALDLAGFDLRELGAATPDELTETAAALRARIETLPGRRTATRALRTRLGEAVAPTGPLPVTTVALAREARQALDEAAAWAVTSREQVASLRARLASLRPARRDAHRQDNASWLRGRFHLYWFNHYGLAPPGLEAALRYMGAMHASGLQERFPVRFHAGRGETEQEYLANQLNRLERENMKMFLAYTSPAGWLPAWKEKFLAEVKRGLDAVGDHPAFGGLQFDEIHLTPYRDRVTLAGLRDYLRTQYTREELVDLGVLRKAPSPLPSPARGEGEKQPRPLTGSLLGEGEADPSVGRPAEPYPPFTSIEDIVPTTTRTNDVEQVLWLEHREYCRQAFVDLARSVFDYAHSIRPDALMFVLLSPAQFLSSPFNASIPLIAPEADMMAIDPYWNGVPEEALFCDLVRSCAKGPTLLTVGMCYGSRTPDTVARDLAIAFAHTEGVYAFDWPWCFKQPPYLKPEWTHFWHPPGKWDKVWDFAIKAQRLQSYLLDTASPSRVGLVFSERSSTILDANTMAMSIVAGDYRIGFMGLYCLLMQAKLQVDPLYAERLSAERLAPYRVLILPHAACLTDEEQAALREWVHAGGHLVATASSSRLDRWGRARPDYGLADVFGVKYLGTSTNGMAFGRPPVTYGSGRSYDRVETTTGQVSAIWHNGDPAIVRNRLGAGLSVFVTAQALGACYDAEPRGGEIRPYFAVHKRFHDGVREFVATLVRESLAAQGCALPCRVSNAPLHVEVVVRVQDRTTGRRRVVHLLNYGLQEPVSGVKLRLPVGHAAPARCFYPADGAPAEAHVVNGDIVLEVRDFTVHDVIVVEEEP